MKFAELQCLKLPLSKSWKCFWWCAFLSFLFYACQHEISDQLQLPDSLYTGSLGSELLNIEQSENDPSFTNISGFIRKTLYFKDISIQLKVLLLLGEVYQSLSFQKCCHCFFFCQRSAKFNTNTLLIFQFFWTSVWLRDPLILSKSDNF